jgi:hypothetical protein
VGQSYWKYERGGKREINREAEKLKEGRPGERERRTRTRVLAR